MFTDIFIFYIHAGISCVSLFYSRIENIHPHFVTFNIVYIIYTLSIVHSCCYCVGLARAFSVILLKEK